MAALSLLSISPVNVNYHFALPPRESRTRPKEVPTTALSNGEFGNFPVAKQGSVAPVWQRCQFHARRHISAARHRHNHGEQQHAKVETDRAKKLGDDSHRRRVDSGL
ncbi:MAG: hypothetical protein Q8Q26_05020 [Pseudorhodobacter sp.]|nr:hypothetical protein [Pseudorhodobacter sp.]